MPDPAWYAKVVSHPDYDGDRLIMIDSNVILELTNRGAWDEELDFVFNSPPERLRLKVNAQVWFEVMGGGAENSGMPVSELIAQRDFVQTYRRWGKIRVDEGAAPFFRPSRLSDYQRLDNLLTATSNLSREDRPTVTDAIINRIPLLTREKNIPDGLAKALRNGGVRAFIRSNGLPATLSEILLRS